jgi:hypothetical protein
MRKRQREREREIDMKKDKVCGRSSVRVRKRY